MRISIDVTPEELEAYDKAAREADTTRETWIRLILNAGAGMPAEHPGYKPRG